MIKSFMVPSSRHSDEEINAELEANKISEHQIINITAPDRSCIKVYYREGPSSYVPPAAIILKHMNAIIDDIDNIVPNLYVGRDPQEMASKFQDEIKRIKEECINIIIDHKSEIDLLIYDGMMNDIKKENKDDK